MNVFGSSHLVAHPVDLLHVREDHIRINSGKERELYGVLTIEILGATLEEACLKKGEYFSADFHPILCS
jgi:hypothetical protein